jgi:hypothetical protein
MLLLGSQSLAAKSRGPWSFKPREHLQITFHGLARVNTHSQAHLHIH